MNEIAVEMKFSTAIFGDVFCNENKFLLVCKNIYFTRRYRKNIMLLFAYFEVDFVTKN